MDNSRFKILFQRYIDQSCTKDEQKVLMQMIASSKFDAELQSMMDTLWQAPMRGEQLSRDKMNEILSGILAQSTTRAQRETADVPVMIPERPQWLTRNWFRIAAVIAFFVLCCGAVYLIQFSSPASTGTVASRIEVSDDEHQFVMLPDGSTVVLNAGSTLDYADSFEANQTREVTLSGEGYFDITHDPSRPFIVHTGKLKTTVLGTAFNIRAYAHDNNITVTVTRGKVKVSDEKREFGVILPDQQITFDGKNNSVERGDVNSQAAIAWAENDIFFNEITVAEATLRLEERFNVKIDFENAKLKQCRFTATFIHNESLDQILAVICEFNNATYRRDDAGKIIISGDGC